MAELFCTVERNRKKICFADVKTFLQRGNEDDSPVSIAQYNKEIDEALVEAGAGNYITQEEMEKELLNGKRGKVAIEGAKSTCKGV